MMITDSASGTTTAWTVVASARCDTETVSPYIARRVSISSVCSPFMPAAEEEGGNCTRQHIGSAQRLVFHGGAPRALPCSCRVLRGGRERVPDSTARDSRQRPAVCGPIVLVAVNIVAAVVVVHTSKSSSTPPLPQLRIESKTLHLRPRARTLAALRGR